jgi:hypothetical protein
MTALRYVMFFGVSGPLLGAAVLFGAVTIISFATGEPAEVSDYFLALPRILLMSIWIVPAALLLGINRGRPSAVAKSESAE